MESGRGFGVRAWVALWMATLVLAACRGGNEGQGRSDSDDADVGLSQGDDLPAADEAGPSTDHESEVSLSDPGPNGPDEWILEVLDAEASGPEVIFCEFLPPLAKSVPFEVTGGFEADGGVESFTMNAVVSGRRFVSDSVLGDLTEWRFRSEDGGAEVVLRTRLPLNYEISVAVGQRVVLFGARMQYSGWRDLAFVIYSGGHLLALEPVFFFYDASHPGYPPWHQCGQKVPCPRIRMLDTDCPPQDDGCGLMVHPPIEFLAHGGVSSGEVPLPLEQGQSVVGFEGYRYTAIRSDRYVEMRCPDLPQSWLTAMFGNSRWVSQCVCREDADCAPGFFCDPTTSRCLEDLCRAEVLDEAGKTCKEGFVCNPYRKECWNPATTPVTTCKRDADCEEDEVCNERGRLCSGKNDCTQILHFCVKNPCAVMDCATPCHTLLGRCTQCLADCECERTGDGNFCNDYSCETCDQVPFGQENPERYEFFEVCIRKDSVDPEVMVKAIDPSMYCLPGATGAFAKCDPATEVLCHGPLDFLPGLKWVTDEKWGRLCRISNLPRVVKVAGGHYL